ncbi:hypothetical protein [Paenibacillus durus]|uniref:Uncharacterized protein n=1 Tax=Paenibacillus durus ATCC 35681 TaxID=1333534 RepID=A0A0F7FCN5_PAEDU|nr:hypothetical protein [Paenibacillus durus]AKG36113.1 hypothetical protein VK70_17390 [Paenibacillus durus ATCC 35681]
METVHINELLPHSYINHYGEVITLDQAKEIIAAGGQPILYTVTDDFIAAAVKATSEEFKDGIYNEVFTAPDPGKKLVLYGASAETLKISCHATGGPYGAGVYEIHDEHNRFLGLCSVPALKELGVVRRIDHYRKAEAFLNTAAGREWFMQNRRFS